MSDEIAYRDLRAGETIQAGDQFQAKDGTGLWQEYHPSLLGGNVLEASIARRPYNITDFKRAWSATAALNEDLNHQLQQQGPQIEHLIQQLAIARTTAEHWEARTNIAANDTAQSILEQLEIAATAFDAIADVGDQSEVGYACGMSAAIAVVRRYAERATHAH